MEADEEVALTPAPASFFPAGAAGSKYLLVTPVTVKSVTSRQFAGLLPTEVSKSVSTADACGLVRGWSSPWVMSCTAARGDIVAAMTHFPQPNSAKRATRVKFGGSILVAIRSEASGAASSQTATALNHWWIVCPSETS
jgi:hypothetical protein